MVVLLYGAIPQKERQVIPVFEVGVDRHLALICQRLQELRHPTILRAGSLDASVEGVAATRQSVLLDVAQDVG